MDLQARDDSNHRKQKKKKHHSPSQSKKHKKEKDRGASKEHKKKDKDKKKHKSKSKEREEKDHRDDRRDRDGERKDKDKEREEKEKERELRKQKEREQRREKDKEKEKKDKQERDRSRDKKDRDRSKEKRDRSKDKAKDKSQRKQAKQKEREGSKSKKKQRSQQKAKKRDHSPSRKRQDSRDKKREDSRRQQRPRQQQYRKRFDDRDRRGKDRQREDKYQRWRKQAQFRFDSPPKSDQSDMSDDPEKMDKLNKMKAQKQLVTSKADRKLYLGNLPPNITSNQLMQMLNSALKKMEINCQEEGDSIVSAWISPDGVGHYAFVQFRTAQEATAGLALNGASLYGYQLKLGRPKQYIEYHKQLLSEFGSDGNIDTILRKVQAMGGFIQPPRIEQRLVNPPSKVIVLKHIVTVQELAIDEQYNEIVEDVTEMARRHGDVLKVAIPRPMEIDLQQVKTRVKGLGYIFIKYKSAEQARYARKQLIKQMFSERSVACSFFSEKKFEQGQLDVIDKVIIDF